MIAVLQSESFFVSSKPLQFAYHDLLEFTIVSASSTTAGGTKMY